MKTKFFVLLLALCLLLSVSAVASYAIEARDGEVGDDNGVVTTAGDAVTTTVAVTLTTAEASLTTTAATTAPTTTAAVTTAPVTTGMIEDAEEGSAFAIVLAILAAVAIVALVVVLVPKMRR